MNTLKTLSIKWVSKIQDINILLSVEEVRNNGLSDFEKLSIYTVIERASYKD